MRTLTATIKDSAGIQVTVSWPVRSDQRDSHADAQAMVASLYERVVGPDSPMASHVQVSTTFVDADA